MRRTAASVLAVAGVLLALAGCGSTAPAAAPPAPFTVPTAAAAPTTTAVVLTPAQEDLFGPRVELPGGLLLKQIGKVAQGANQSDPPDVYRYRLIVDSIKVDPKCDPYMPKPPRGHRLLVAVRVETTAIYSPMEDASLQFNSWSTIGSDGVTEGPASSGSPCRSATDLPFEMRPSAKYRGEITVDTANAAGQLVLTPGFVWKYPTA